MSSRIELEAMRWPSNVFATLTYSDDALPWTTADGTGAPTLVPRDTQLFMKRLLKVAKKEFGWQQRMFLVGEYGDRTWRPHYHAAFFNFPACRRGTTLRSLTRRYLWAECCAVCRMVGDAWNSGGDTRGDIGLGMLDQDRARYLASYTVKKMTRKEDARLDGRHPEFSRQSRGGRKKGSYGVGASMVADMARTFLSYREPGEVDVPPNLTRNGGKSMVLGPYLRKKLREACGTTEEVKKVAADQAWVEQVLPLLEMAKTDAEAPTLRAQFRKKNAAYAARLEWLDQQYRQRKKGREL